MIEFFLKLVGLRKCGCYDEPDSRDYAFKSTGTKELPKIVDMLNTYCQDQLNKGACTGFGVTHCFEIQKIIELHFGWQTHRQTKKNENVT